MRNLPLRAMRSSSSSPLRLVATNCRAVVNCKIVNCRLQLKPPAPAATVRVILVLVLLLVLVLAVVLVQVQLRALLLNSILVRLVRQYIQVVPYVVHVLVAFVVRGLSFGSAWC